MSFSSKGSVDPGSIEAMIDCDLPRKAFMVSRSKEGFPFTSQVRRVFKCFLDKVCGKAHAWRETFDVEADGDDDRTATRLGAYRMSDRVLYFESDWVVRCHDRHGEERVVPLVGCLERLPLPTTDTRSPDIQLEDPYALQAKLDAQEAIHDRIATDLANPTYRNALIQALLEGMGLRGGLPWSLVPRSAHTMVVRGKQDFVYYLARWEEASEGSLEDLAKEGWLEKDGHLVSCLLQVFVPLLVLFCRGISVAHGHLTPRAIRYTRTSKKTLDFVLDKTPISFPTYGYTFYVVDWHHGCLDHPLLGGQCGTLKDSSVASWKDVVGLGFALHPYLLADSALQDVFRHWCMPLVGGSPLDLEGRYARCGGSLSRLMDFRPDSPELYSLHAAVTLLAPCVQKI